MHTHIRIHSTTRIVRIVRIVRMRWIALCLFLDLPLNLCKVGLTHSLMMAYMPPPIAPIGAAMGIGMSVVFVILTL